MWLILLLLWMFDVVTFKTAILWWLAWIVFNIAFYILAGAVYYTFLIAPILEVF